LGEKIEIYKFKITVFMAIIVASSYLVVNFDLLLKFIKIKEILVIFIYLLFLYGTVGFIINMYKLSVIEKEL